MKSQKSIGRQRLAKLATFLYRVPRDKFDMTRFKVRAIGKLSLNPVECNTQGCAIGWATVLFADEGFCLTPDFRYGNIPMPEWGMHDGWKAIEELLDLNTQEATELFSNNPTTEDLGPRQVAVRIRKFLKTGKV